jgi:hypothetical protein
MNILERKLDRKLIKYLPYCLFTDKLYAKERYYNTFGRKLNLKFPRSFNEKIQWLKLYKREKRLSTLADKYLVRDYVREIIGSEYLIPLFGIYHNVNEIDFEQLPNKFVMKVNHFSGGNIICKNKSKLNWDEAKSSLNIWLNNNYYKKGREWVYKNIEPRIICEQYLEEDEGKDILDFKFFCFDGNPKLIQVDIDRFSEHRKNMYDTKWNKLPFTFNYPDYKHEILKPSNLNIMTDIAGKLSKGLDFCRVDLYSINENVFFGEITMYPANGFGKFIPDEWDYKIGEYLKLRI